MLLLHCCVAWAVRQKGLLAVDTALAQPGVGTAELVGRESVPAELLRTAGAAQLAVCRAAAAAARRAGWRSRGRSGLLAVVLRLWAVLIQLADWLSCCLVPAHGLCVTDLAAAPAPLWASVVRASCMLLRTSAC